MKAVVVLFQELPSFITRDFVWVTEKKEVNPSKLDELSLFSSLPLQFLHSLHLNHSFFTLYFFLFIISHEAVVYFPSTLKKGVSTTLINGLSSPKSWFSFPLSVYIEQFREWDMSHKLFGWITNKHIQTACVGVWRNHHFKRKANLSLIQWPSFPSLKVRAICDSFGTRLIRTPLLRRCVCECERVTLALKNDKFVTGFNTSIFPFSFFMWDCSKKWLFRVTFSLLFFS